MVFQSFFFHWVPNRFQRKCVAHEETGVWCTYESNGVQGRVNRRMPPSRSTCCWDTVGRMKSRASSWTSRADMENTQKCRPHLYTNTPLSIWTQVCLNHFRSSVLELYLLFGCSSAAQAWPSSLPPESQLFSSTGCLYLTSGSPETKFHTLSHRIYNPTLTQRGRTTN